MISVDHCDNTIIRVLGLYSLFSPYWRHLKLPNNQFSETRSLYFVDIGNQTNEFTLILS